MIVTYDNYVIMFVNLLLLVRHSIYLSVLLFYIHCIFDILFNQDISQWNVSNVLTMFYGASFLKIHSNGTKDNPQ